MDKIEGMDDFIRAWTDCFKCHYALWKTGVEHGDISIWNLMWDKMNKCGILNDWDLAFVRGGIRKDGKLLEGHGGERTGTVPFMARGLLNLNDKHRLYRHEVESFIWVFTWICIKNDHSEVIKQWRTGSCLAVAHAKSHFILDDYQFLKVSDNVNGLWEKCKLLIRLLRKIENVRDECAYMVEPDADLIHQAVLHIIEQQVAPTYFSTLTLLKPA
ncbi:hypothetical protein BDQ17DRAFT_1281313 [Cyathus striatus]|nr:hypothetical protein BDQ17DRAFT_1281313 [Cyathus striatus]